MDIQRYIATIHIPIYAKTDKKALKSIKSIIEKLEKKHGTPPICEKVEKTPIGVLIPTPIYNWGSESSLRKSIREL